MKNNSLNISTNFILQWYNHSKIKFHRRFQVTPFAYTFFEEFLYALVNTNYFSWRFWQSSDIIMCNLLGDLGIWLTLLCANEEMPNKGKWGRKNMPWYGVSHSTKFLMFHYYHHCRPVQKFSLLASIDKKRPCNTWGGGALHPPPDH